MVRPSKSFLFDYLESKLKKFRSGVGIDAGSANFKNRRFFKTDKYFGLDIDEQALKNGLEKYPNDNTNAILADLAHLEKLPSNSVDLIVSSNTLYALSVDLRLKAIENLALILAPNGQLFCELVLDKDFPKALKIIKSRFNHVKVVYYKNIFSRAYEGIFEKDGYLGSHPIAGLKPFRLLAWIVSRLEYLTLKFSFLNKHVIIIAHDKKEKVQKNQFDLSHTNLKTDRLFNILN